MGNQKYPAVYSFARSLVRSSGRIAGCVLLYILILNLSLDDRLRIINEKYMKRYAMSLNSQLSAGSKL